MKYVLSGMALMFAVSTPVLAINWEGMDTNEDGDITEEEWDASKAGSSVFDDWDTDDDGYINESEYATGLFGVYDANDDGNITEEEWEMTFNEAWANDGGYNEWNVDNDPRLNQDEFSAGMFEYYDLNENSVIDKDERQRALRQRLDL